MKERYVTSRAIDWSISVESLHCPPDDVVLKALPNENTVFDEYEEKLKEAM
ncbi:MAG: hypothetical protein ACPGVT_10995 [Maricaulaceae bacterium]